MIEIREAEDRDLEAMGELWEQFMKYHEDIDPVWGAEPGSTPVYIEEYLKPPMRDENSLVLVSEEDGKLTGYSYSYINPSHVLSKRPAYGFIHDMFITAGSRRNGTGDKMVQKIKEWFTQNGIDRIELDVAWNNATGESFWRKQGFDDIKKGFYLLINGK